MAVDRSYIPPMGCTPEVESFHACLGAFRPERYAVTRSLALYSASIALADHETLRTAQQICRDCRATGPQIYEVMLQSYLFLGFPRMLTAAEQLYLAGIQSDVVTRGIRVTASDFHDWAERGSELCRRVYDSNYDILKSRVEAIAPEIFLWMELEGYGKVLSRSGLDIIEREMAIVACLIMENRPVQLHSHLRGALNVGAPQDLLLDVVSDMAPAAPEGHASSVEILRKLGLQ